jgi:hypothetical protein
MSIYREERDHTLDQVIEYFPWRVFFEKSFSLFLLRFFGGGVQNLTSKFQDSSFLGKTIDFENKI